MSKKVNKAIADMKRSQFHIDYDALSMYTPQTVAPKNKPLPIGCGVADATVSAKVAVMLATKKRKF